MKDVLSPEKARNTKICKVHSDTKVICLARSPVNIRVGVLCNNS